MNQTFRGAFRGWGRALLRFDQWLRIVGASEFGWSDANAVMANAHFALLESEGLGYAEWLRGRTLSGSHLRRATSIASSIEGALDDVKTRLPGMPTVGTGMGQAAPAATLSLGTRLWSFARWIVAPPLIFAGFGLAREAWKDNADRIQDDERNRQTIEGNRQRALQACTTEECREATNEFYDNQLAAYTGTERECGITDEPFPALVGGFAATGLTYGLISHFGGKA